MDKPKYKYPKGETVWTSYYTSSGDLMPTIYTNSWMMSLRS